jgi:hypothetical protein
VTTTPGSRSAGAEDPPPAALIVLERSFVERSFVEGKPANHERTFVVNPSFERTFALARSGR